MRNSNSEGVKDLQSRKGHGREPSLTRVPKAALRALVIQGSDSASHKDVPWRCLNLHIEVARRWWLELHE